MDSLNDRGDSSEQVLTPLELAKLQIEASSPVANINANARFQTQEIKQSKTVENQAKND